MKKLPIFFLLLSFFGLEAFSQENVGRLRELHRKRLEAKEDTALIRAYRNLSVFFRNSNQSDSAVYYGLTGLQLAREKGKKELELEFMIPLHLAYQALGDEANGLYFSLEGLKLAKELGLKDRIAGFTFTAGVAYSNLGQKEKALQLFQESFQIRPPDETRSGIIIGYAWLGMAYYEAGNRDSAFHYINRSKSILLERRKEKMERGDSTLFSYHPIFFLGDIYWKEGNIDSSLYYYKWAYKESIDQRSRSALMIADILTKEGRDEEAKSYLFDVLQSAKESNDHGDISRSAKSLARIFEPSDPRLALEYSKMAIASTDSINELRLQNAFNNLTKFDRQINQYELEKAKQEYQFELRQNLFLAVIFVVALIALIILYFYRDKNRRNKLLAQQKEELAGAINHLKSTQAQLIQSEKMASLGELTAGIAHEIQNPLNFVNNFSEVSRELLGELTEEIEKGDWEEVKALAGDVIQNLEKINHHGKRADGIVKGMLQHSRSSEGKKEPTDLNALAGEYLRLAYHGLRARDKGFNASIEMDSDPALPTVEVVPQDIGRVLLNLLTNAFHAVNERKAKSPEGYNPTVWVETRKIDKAIELTVRDNGGGIPEEIRDKIFQPFFTTKPTGQGTGLGLSLSYDIVKAHGGTLVLDASGEGALFKISFPIV